MTNYGVIGLKIQDVILIDTWGHHQIRALKDRFSQWRVLNEFK